MKKAHSTSGNDFRSIRKIGNNFIGIMRDSDSDEDMELDRPPLSESDRRHFKNFIEQKNIHE